MKSYLFALKAALKELRRNSKSLDNINPPYGSQFNSRVSAKTSLCVSRILNNMDLQILSDIKEFDSRRVSYSADAFISDWIDLFFIIGIIKLSKSKKILELGGGVSTCAIASTLSKLDSETSFTSVDDSKKWGDLTEKLVLDIVNPLNKCKFKQIISPLKEYEVNNFSVMGYEKLKNEKFDYIYIDPFNMHHPYCLDPIRLNMISSQTIIQIDGRNLNVAAMNKCLKSKGGNWKVFRFAYPCDDALFINTEHAQYKEILNQMDGVITPSW